MGALLSEVAAIVDAYVLAHELIQLDVPRSMKVYDQTDLGKIETSGPKLQVILKTGQIIEAKKIIFCIGFESTKLLKEKVADLFYTNSTVSEQGVQLNSSFKNTLIWYTGDPNIYMRTTGDDRLLVGDEDTSFNIPLFQQKLKERKTDKLIKKIIPGIDFIEDFSWAGTFGTTKDRLPYIGKSPEYENTFFVLGFGGNGITFSVLGMMLDMLKGKEHKLGQFYRFGR